MARTANQTETLLAPSDGNDNHVHIVNNSQWLLGDVLRLKTPRALCGIALVRDPDKPEPGANAPICPKCKAINGPGDLRWIPGKG
jgi:hypothetical protein